LQITGTRLQSVCYGQGLESDCFT